MARRKQPKRRDGRSASAPLFDPAEAALPREAIEAIATEPRLQPILAGLERPGPRSPGLRVVDGRLVPRGAGRRARRHPLTQIATELKRRERFISQLFLAQTGLRLSYVERLFMTRRVAISLRDTQEKVDTIAKAEGFSCGSALARSFAATVHVTPNEYRAWVRKKRGDGAGGLGSAPATGPPGSDLLL